MHVRCWLIVGSRPQTGLLDHVEPLPQFCGQIPDAVLFLPGALAEWFPTPGSPPVVLVCVDVPL